MGHPLNIFRRFRVYDAHATNMEKGDTWPEVSKINLHVTPSAKNRCLFLGMVFYFFRKCFSFMHGKIPQFLREPSNLSTHALENNMRNASVQFID